jgi:hypothetical protein
MAGCNLLHLACGTPRHSTNGLQKSLLDQAIEVVPDVIGMGGAAEMEAQLKVGKLGGIGEVGAGDEQLLIGHHRLDMTDRLFFFKREGTGIE